MSNRIEIGNADARKAWTANAEFWDARMADGNDFVRMVLWPAVEALLQPKAGQCLLDVACGNGITSRRLAQYGAQVIACDFSDAMIALAKERGASPNGNQIDYRLVDATDRQALLTLGAGKFDGILCNMAIMDMAEIAPLMEAARELLRPAGRFVFSVVHPCFNNPSTVQFGELEDRKGTLVTTYGVRVTRYLTAIAQNGLAMHGQPVPHPYFHRPLGELLGAAFQAGLVLDALEERAFPAEYRGGTTPLSWSGHFSEIPPVLIARLRPTAQ